jgi:hypothetical protein
VTGSGRLYLKNVQHATYRHVNGPDNCDSWLMKKSLSDMDRRIIQAAKDYMIYVSNKDYEITIHKLIIESIIKERPDVIMIPCFDQNSVPSDIYNGIDPWTVSKIDIKHFKLQQEDYRWPGSDLRHAHMNDDNNRIFAELLDKYLISDRKQRFTLNIDSFVLPTQDRDYYFLSPKSPGYLEYMKKAGYEVSPDGKIL